MSKERSLKYAKQLVHDDEKVLAAFGAGLSLSLGQRALGLFGPIGGVLLFRQLRPRFIVITDKRVLAFDSSHFRQDLPVSLYRASHLNLPQPNQALGY